MTRRLAWVAIGIALIAAAPRAQQADDPIGPLRKVRNNLFVIAGQGGNTAVFVTPTEVVLVDTKLPGSGPAILERLAGASDVPVATIINTHAHIDHVGSNDFFPSSVEIVAQENTRKALERMPEIARDPAAVPDTTFRDRLTIGSGRDRIDLYYFGPAHTDGDAVVVFPGARAMHAGDLFGADTLVDPALGGSVTALRVTLRRIVDTIHDVDTVIPGHGAVTTWRAFVEYARRIERGDR
jgi:glyoxylase-like metal-dependent hydrolase (beta-lactamase superfamily II)